MVLIHRHTWLTCLAASRSQDQSVRRACCRGTGRHSSQSLPGQPDGNSYLRTSARSNLLRKLSKSPELLQAIVSNDDNLSYGFVISVYTGDDEPATALTDDGWTSWSRCSKTPAAHPKNGTTSSTALSTMSCSSLASEPNQWNSSLAVCSAISWYDIDFAKADGLRRRSRIAVARRSAVARRLD